MTVEQCVNGGLALQHTAAFLCSTLKASGSQNVYLVVLVVSVVSVVSSVEKD